jgi:hypothetical protein
MCIFCGSFHLETYLLTKFKLIVFLLLFTLLLGNSGKHITLETSQSNGILKVCFSGAGNSRIQEVRDLRSLKFANVQSSGILIR